jgi:hypothetical protein
METAQQMFERIINSHPDLVRALARRQPSYRFYQDRATQSRYFYTTERIKHGQGMKYVAGIYRYLKTRKAYKLVKRVGFARRWKAKQWANQTYCKAIKLS